MNKNKLIWDCFSQSKIFCIKFCKIIYVGTLCPSTSKYKESLNKYMFISKTPICQKNQQQKITKDEVKQNLKIKFQR